MGAVKEQSANLYATKLAEQGFITVSLDLPTAVDYLGTLNFVDRGRIEALGICGIGSFVISAAKIDPRLKAIATSTMYDMDAVSPHRLQHAQDIDQRKQVITAAAEQRWIDIHGGERQYTSGTLSNLTANSTAVDREGSTPELTTHPTLSSNTKSMNFYPFNDIQTISPRPLLFISGDQAHSCEFSEDAYARAAEPKELVWVAGAGHVDLYDGTELIPFAKLTNFFQTSLA
ncbi:hypothetical protein BDW59DRAFT_163552 [Aspergillus cavernicola]|uniref:Alpha/beta hydrolase n=1 Tax=Aspergillus cavernicola TaxID=176166 RepID=A0ABR4I639_9EURO